MTIQWIAYICECGQRYAIEETPVNEIEEPCCPVCGSDNAVTEGQADVTFQQPVMVS